MTDPKFNDKVLSLIQEKPKFTIEGKNSEGRMVKSQIKVDWEALFMEIYEYQRIAMGSSGHHLFCFTTEEFENVVQYVWCYASGKPLSSTSKVAQAIIDKLCEIGLCSAFSFKVTPVLVGMDVEDQMNGYGIWDLTKPVKSKREDLPAVSEWNATSFHDVFDFIKVSCFSGYHSDSESTIQDILKAMILYTYYWNSKFRGEYLKVSKNDLYLWVLSNMGLKPTHVPLWLPDLWNTCLDELVERDAFFREMFPFNGKFEMDDRFFAEFTAYSYLLWQHGIGKGWVGIQKDVYQQFSNEI